jgi:predicted branched-subunit amino acid permease
LIPVVPFALVLGVAITETVMPAGVAWSTNFFVFAGAAQLALISLAATASWLTLVATAIVINLRHVMYSAAMAPRFADQPTWVRWVGPLFLIDQVFALLAARPELTGRDFRRTYLTTGVLFFTVWTTTVTAGIFIGGIIPTSWRLDVAPAIMFVGIVILGLVSRANLGAAIVGALVCAVAIDLPNNLGLLVGALAGVLAGFLLDQAPVEAQAQS